MDDDEGAGRRQQQRQKRVPEYKYKNMLQKLANREIHEVILDLDDLAAVRNAHSSTPNVALEWRHQDRR